MSWYALFQLVAVVLLLNIMQSAELAYWSGFCLWALLLATTVTTALWLEGRAAQYLLKWEALRLVAIGLLSLLAWRSGLSSGSLAVAAVYLALNLLFLTTLARANAGGDAATAH